ncbi:hypothetical protein [Salinibaculum salinum]|uniref:hypothetical protein n=1 Tax=Salinibaculum salinum TaxID=3131996 RepID=UPI0030EE63C8
MSDDLPTDVVTVITQLCAETRRALTGGDHETACATTDTMRRVATNKLPEGHHRQTVRHACDRITALLDGDPEVAVAVAYVDALERSFPTVD